MEQLAARELGDDGPVTKQLILKPLDRQLAEHKDVTKAVTQLNSIISSLKVNAGDILVDLVNFSTLWDQVSNTLTLYFIPKAVNKRQAYKRCKQD